MELVQKFDTFHFEHIHQVHNEKANNLAQCASGYGQRQGYRSTGKLPMFHAVLDTSANEKEESDNGLVDWRQALKECIREPGNMRDSKLQQQTLMYTLVDGELYRQTVDGVLLKCLDKEQA
jgi:hypothetical protein